MLIRALMDLQNRMVAENKLHPVQDFEKRRITHIVHLEPDGSVRSLTPQTSGNQEGIFYDVPVIDRTSGVVANLLWDTAEYVFGIGDKGAKKIQSFRETVDLVYNAVTREMEMYPGLDALRSFYDPNKGHFDTFTRSPAYASLLNEIEAAAGKGVSFNIAFTIDGRPLHLTPGLDRHLIRSNLDHKAGQEPQTGRCVVTGEVGVLGRLHGKIKGVAGSSSMGGPLVSFNQNCFESFGLKDGDNGRMLERVTRGYHRALNALLANREEHHLLLEKSSYVVWVEDNRQPSPLDLVHGSLVGSSKPKRSAADLSEDDDEEVVLDRVETLKALLNVGRVAQIRPEPIKGEINLLKLQCSSARIVVADHIQAPAEEVYRQALRWYDDLTVEQGTRFGVKTIQPPTVKEIIAVLSGYAYGGSREYWSILKEYLLDAAFTGGRINSRVEYAVGVAFHTKLHTVIKQSANGRDSISVERFIYRLAALAKLILIRNYHREDISVVLNKDRTEIGYLLGRLFALYEYAQRKAMADVNTSVMSRVKAAMDMPAHAFPALAKLNFAHLSKLRQTNESAYCEIQIGEVVSKLNGTYPRALKGEQQMWFVEGYWHQRTALFTKAPKQEETVSEAA